MIDAHENITVHLNMPCADKKTTVKYFFIVPVGRSKVIAADGMVNIQPV